MTTATPRRRKARRPAAPAFAPPRPPSDRSGEGEPDPLTDLDARVLGRPAGSAPATAILQTASSNPPYVAPAAWVADRRGVSPDPPPDTPAPPAAPRGVPEPLFDTPASPAAPLEVPDPLFGTPASPAAPRGVPDPPFAAPTASVAQLRGDSPETPTVAPAPLAASPPDGRASQVGKHATSDGGRLIGVVTRDGTLAAALGGVAAGLRRGGAPVVVTAARAALLGGLPALPRAARLARRLRSVGLDATAAGARCHVRLPDDPLLALAEAGRLVAAAAGVPVVVATTDRSEELDRLLARADRLVLALPASTHPALATLAFDSLARLGPPVEPVRAPSDLPGRAAASLGLRGLAPAEPADA